MNDDVLADVQRRLGNLGRTSARFRSGEITDTSPLSVALGGASVPYVGVASLEAGLLTGDRVAVLTFGNDLLVLGCITDDPGVRKAAFPFATNWSNLGSGFETATYTRAGSVVRLQGDVTKSSAPSPGDLVGTLPADCWPQAVLEVPCLSGNTSGSVASGWLRVGTDGTVKWQAGTSTGTPVVSFTGVSFLV